MKDNVFCPIPWNFSAIRSNGDFRVCCHANQSVGKGVLQQVNGENFNAAKDGFSETRNAPRLMEMRRQMLENKWPSECIRCQKEEESNLRSRREYEREAWFIDNEYAKSRTLESGEINNDDFPIHYIDLRFGNQCNLACRMCGPQDSTSWYSDYAKLEGRDYFYDTHGKVSLEKLPNGKYKTDDYSWYEQDQFWKSLECVSADLTQIYMAGGEPLLIKKHYSFLEKCIEKELSQNIVLEYNTNMTVLDQRIIDLWKNFKGVRVGASIDGFGKVFEYQRYPAKWDNIHKNLVSLDSLPDHVSSWLAVTITNYNIFHIAEFIKWKVEKSGFGKISSSKNKPFITHHMCHTPKYLNVKSLKFELKQVVIGQFAELREWAQRKELSDRDMEALDKLLSGIEKFMMSEHYSESWDDFVSVTKKLDKIRGQDVVDVVPELKEYF